MARNHLPTLFVHPFAPAGLFLLLCVFPRPYMFAVVSTVILHEMGHLTASLLFRKYPLSFTLMPTGISIALPSPSSYTEEIVVSGAGPLMNLLYCLLASLFPSALAMTVRTVALLLMVVNLLPLASFDGGRMLHASLSYLFGEGLAERVLQVTTAFTLAVLWILSLYIFFYSGVNMTLLLFCAYLFSFYLLKKK